MSTTTFNLKDLSNAVSHEFDVTSQVGISITRFVFDRIKAELLAGKQVRIHQFGTLEARVRKASTARNPVTGSRMALPARRVVKLTVADRLKTQVAALPS